MHVLNKINVIILQ